MRGDGLAAWLRFFAAMAAPGATLTLIHRPECLVELLALFEGRFGGAAVFPLFPKADAPASRVIVQARKGSRAGMNLLPGLVLHRPDGRYTADAEAVLRGGEPLRLDRLEKKGRRLGG
jgi:tRNA1(Val) A37 N6-methylase TrmN6